MKFDLQPVRLAEVRHLFAAHHGYKSVGNLAVYAFAVVELGQPVAAFVWQPPPPGAAKAVCAEAPHGVLALSRMVAVPKSDRALKHISKPLRAQMKALIDRTRWPVLLTYSDESQGHTGYVYQCSGWERAGRTLRPCYIDASGSRVSSYTSGRHVTEGKTRVEDAWMTRWEHWACPKGYADAWMTAAGWRAVETGKTYRSGNKAKTYIRQVEMP